MEIPVEQAMQQAVTAQREGRLQEAELLYRSILQSQPTHAAANYNLGLLALSVNKADAAIPLFKSALEAYSSVEQFWLSYIDALLKERQIEKAREIIEEGKKQGVFGEKLNALETQLLYLIQKPEPEKSGPSPQQINSLLEWFQAGEYDDTDNLSMSLTQEFP